MEMLKTWKTEASRVDVVVHDDAANTMKAMRDVG